MKHIMSFLTSDDTVVYYLLLRMPIIDINDNK